MMGRKRKPSKKTSERMNLSKTKNKIVVCDKCGINNVTIQEEATGGVCAICLCKMVPDTDNKKKTSYKPAGWRFMAEFVDKDGNVYHKGEEQPDLKGTLPPSDVEKIKEEQKKKRDEKKREKELKKKRKEEKLLKEYKEKKELKKLEDSSKTMEELLLDKPKKKRGRPKKEKTKKSSTTTTVKEPKKKRGRPKGSTSTKKMINKKKTSTRKSKATNGGNINSKCRYIAFEDPIHVEEKNKINELINSDKNFVAKLNDRNISKDKIVKIVRHSHIGINNTTEEITLKRRSYKMFFSDGNKKIINIGMKKEM